MTIEHLKENGLILFEAISGSRSFGLDTETSDTDIKGVFYLPKDAFFGLEYIPQISNETNDIVYYELGRFIELLLKNNPNILEILASPQDCVLVKHPVMAKLRLEDFLSKLCKETFAGYAAGQIRKARGLNKKIVNPVAPEKKDLMQFCYVISGASTVSLSQWLASEHKQPERCGLTKIAHTKDMYALFYDDSNSLGFRGITKGIDSNQVQLSSVPEGMNPVSYLYCNHDAYSSYCKDYAQYWEWVEKRNNERYNVNLAHQKNYDSKNMMHTIRLLQSCHNILSTGTLNIRVPNRNELLDIKSGKVEYDDLLSYAEKLLSEIEEAATTSVLKERPDKLFADKLLVEIRTTLYK